MNGKVSNEDQIGRWREALGESSPLEILSWAAEEFGGGVTFASSLGLEDQVLLDMICKAGLDIPVFSLDTGRLFPEVYDLIELNRSRYGVEIELYCPDAAAVEELVNSEGPSLFRKSVELRKSCCRVRKLEPLARALKGKRAWVCGLRREQSETRTALETVEWDDAHGLIKVNPIADWSLERVWDYIRENKVPYNPLYDNGYPSIGCACCTRAVREGEDIRAGRWWWESPAHKECGLHQRGKHVTKD